MIMSSFMTSKGPPKPFFWEGGVGLLVGAGGGEFICLVEAVHGGFDSMGIVVAQRTDSISDCANQ